MARRIKGPVAWVALAALIAPLTLSAQAADSRSVGGPSAFLNSLSIDAQRADSPAGDLSYATELIQMIASHIDGGDVALLSHRLATMDQEARRNGAQYIQEAAVASAFNGMMSQIQGSYATPLRTDAQTVHNLREILAANSPDLTSVNRHPISCLPDEAVLLVFLLLTNNGKVVSIPLGQPPPRDIASGHFADATVNAKVRLERYLAAHSKAGDMGLFSKLFTDIGIR